MSRARTTSRRHASRPARVIAVLTFGATLAAACSGGDDETTVSSVATTTSTIVERADDGRLVIGVFLPRTGPGAALGEPMIAAVENAIAEINLAGGVLDQEVARIVVDENSGTGMAELVNSGVDAIIGPASSTVALSQLDDAVAQDTGVVVCSPSATSLALDNYPDNKFFFRTVPSDSLQMTAIARRAAGTGVASVSVGYLDDIYGRGLASAFKDAADDFTFEITAEVGFIADQEDLRDTAAQLLAGAPGVIVVLGGPDDGTRLLVALDAATQGRQRPEVIVNDAVRTGRQAISALSDDFRASITGLAPLAKPTNDADADGFFTGNAADCVNLIALATLEAGTDTPLAIQQRMAAVSVGGRSCVSFADCVEKLRTGLQIDYNGSSGGVELSTTSGDLAQGWFEVFAFDEEGVDFRVESDSPVQVP